MKTEKERNTAGFNQSATGLFSFISKVSPAIYGHKEKQFLYI